MKETDAYTQRLMNKNQGQIQALWSLKLKPCGELLLNMQYYEFNFRDGVQAGALQVRRPKA